MSPNWFLRLAKVFWRASVAVAGLDSFPRILCVPRRLGETTDRRRAWTRGQRWGDAVAGDVEMDWTRLPSGGKRPWFRCPSCGRRCGVLYSLGSRIICRKCGGLSYESQYEPKYFGALRKALKIRGRLGGSANMTEPFPSRPRYMHRRTYECLRRRYEAAVEQYVGGL